MSGWGSSGGGGGSWGAPSSHSGGGGWGAGAPSRRGGGGKRGHGGGGSGGWGAPSPSSPPSGFSSSHPSNPDLVPTWSGGWGGRIPGQRDVMEIDMESLSNRTKSMQDSFTIQPSNLHRIPFAVFSSRQFEQPAPDTGETPAVPFGQVSVCEALKQRLVDPRVFAMTMRLRDVKLEDIPFEIELPRGAEPAAIFACIHSPGAPSDAAVSFSLHDVGPDGKAFFSTVWKPEMTQLLPHTAAMLGGVPSTTHGCVLRVGVDVDPTSTLQVQGLMIRIVFRRGVNAPMYRFIGALSAIPANTLDDANAQGVKRLFAHLAHTLPQEVVLQILEFFLPRASASDDDHPQKSGIQYPPVQQFSTWTARSSTNNRKPGAAADFGFGTSSTSSFKPMAWAGEVKPAAPGGWGGVVPAPERQQGTTRQFAGFGNKPAPNAKKTDRATPEGAPPAHFVARASDPFMLALPCLKSLRIASYVTAPEVLAIPKWCLGPQRQRDAIIGTPMPDGTNFFTAPRYEGRLSALVATEDGSGICYADSLSLTTTAASNTSHFSMSNPIRQTVVNDFTANCRAAPNFCGYEFRATSWGGIITLTLEEMEGPLLLLHNCCSEDIASASDSPPSLRQANGAAEVDGMPLMSLSNMVGNVSCNWLLPKNTTKGSLQLKFTATGERALSMRLLTPRCWKRLAAFPAPPPSLEAGKPVVVELPPAVFYPLAGVNPRTFNPNVKLTATAVFSDKSVGKPVAGILGHAFTAAELLGVRSADEMEGVTVRIEDLDVQLIATLSNGQNHVALPLFGLCGFRAQTCITRTMFDDRPKDDGFNTLIHLLGSCETESYYDEVQLGASSTERLTRGWGGTAAHGEFDPAKAVNAVKRSASIVTFDVTKAHNNNNNNNNNRGGGGWNNGGGGGGGWGAPSAPTPVRTTTPYECMSVEARALADPLVERNPLRIKELVVFIANKDGLDQKIDDILGPSSCK